MTRPTDSSAAGSAGPDPTGERDTTVATSNDHGFHHRWTLNGLV